MCIFCRVEYSSMWYQMSSKLVCSQYYGTEQNWFILNHMVIKRNKDNICTGL